MRIALAQINTTVGDIPGNMRKIRASYERAAGLGADLVVCPELCIPGYPPWDLLEREEFVRANLKALQELTRATREAALLVGFADLNPARTGKPLFNAAALLCGGRVAAKRYKTLLPTYDVFDEGRYFEPAPANRPVFWRGLKLGITICEDAWNDPGFWPRRLYATDPVSAQARAGAHLLVNLSASPFDRGKGNLRFRMLRRHARKAHRPFLYCNLVGGNDELVFDGRSLAFDGKGNLLKEGAAFEEDLLLVDVPAPGQPSRGPLHTTVSSARGEGDIRELHDALVLGIRDYAQKCGFRDALVGLSGGIDSSVVCALAVRALGPEHVTGVSMPSRYSSEGSRADAEALARNLGVGFKVLPIEPIYSACLGALREAFAGRPEDASEQNLQARIRGMLLMALSNKHGALLLSTGNKSELATGYCTLYGDMSGGLAAIGDVPKTAVYELARYVNRLVTVIPEACLTKPPSAELKPNQTDQDDLPPYDQLDRVLAMYIEERMSPARISRVLDHGAARVAEVVSRVDRSEYKRRQAPPVLRITPKAFGVGRRMPIARGYPA